MWQRAWWLLRYLLRHKWLFAQEAERLHLSWWTVLLHDVDKLVDPWYWWVWVVRQDAAAANARHHRRARHHWEYWSVAARPDQWSAHITCRSPRLGVGMYLDGEWFIYDLPQPWLREMLADWRAAHRQAGGSDLLGWFVHGLAASGGGAPDAIVVGPRAEAWLWTALSVPAMQRNAPWEA